MMELIQTRSGTSRDAYDFLVAEEKRLKAKLEQSEQALPDFKDITEIKQRIIDQEKEVSTLRQRYRDKHPKLIQALTLLNDSRQEYLSALSTKIPVPAEVKAPRPGETSEERINRILSENEIRYNQLAREVETNKAIYDSVVKRLKETDVSKGVQQINMRISEKAVASGSPSKPKVLLVLALGVFGSLLFGIGIVLGINALDSSLKTVDETERYLGVPVLGAIPEARKDIDKTKIRSKKHLKNSVRDEIQDQIQAKADELQDKIEESGPEWARQGVNRVRTRTRQTREVEPLVMLNQGYSNSAEAFRSLRASFSLLKRDGEPRTFLFTSAVPSEGKSFTSANSAVAFAQTGQKVLLIDADLRRPTQQNLFNRSINDHGLTNALASGRSYKEFIFESSQENLNLLMAGHRAPNPAELLAGGAFERIIKEALQDYDRIVIDSAPINAVSDTIYLLDHVDIVSLVVRAGTTPRRAVARATESLRKAGRKLSGVVLNRLPTRSGFGYDPYFYYYSASDGYGEAYGSSQGS
jgi:capsular exopolysaccharide synthesis family protein